MMKIHVRRKVFTRIKALGRARQYVSQKLSLQLYRSLVLPHFDCADIIHDAASASNANQLQILQNTCLRICLHRNKRSNVKDLHDQANMSTLAIGRQCHYSTLVNKCLLQDSMTHVNTMFTYITDDSGMSIRSSDELKLKVPKCSLQVARGNLRYRGAVYYDDISTEIKKAPSTEAFKSRMKKLTKPNECN